MKLFSKNDFVPLLKLALPLAFTGLVQSAAWFFETLFLARLGSHTLAAGALVSWLFGTLAVILFGILGSINIIVAHKHGANDQDAIAVVARDGILLSICLFIPAFILFWYMPSVFLLFGQSREVVALAASYMHPLAFGLLADFVMMACLEVIIGVGAARVVLICSIISVSLNILCSYVLIFGKLGFPALGIAGAGWGMTISYWITVVVLIFYIFFNARFRNYFRYALKLSKPIYLWEMLQIGVPMGVMYCVEVAFFFAMTLVMGIFGTQIQAANQVALQYLGLCMSIIFSIAQAITVRMGHLLGAKEVREAERAAYSGIFIAVLLVSVAGIFYWFFPNLLISVDFDIHNPANFEIVNVIKNLLYICAIFQLFEAARIAFFGALRALKDTRFTLLASILSFWVIALPVGYFIGTYFQLQGVGMWWGMVLGVIASLILLLWRFQIKIRRFSFNDHSIFQQIS